MKFHSDDIMERTSEEIPCPYTTKYLIIFQIRDIIFQ